MATKHLRTAVSVRRKPKESSEKLVQRFQKKAQASRVIAEVKERQHFRKKPKRRIVRAAALKREFYRAQKEKARFY